MRVDAFDYDLPDELIAQEPLAERRASRLLWLERSTGSIADHSFADLPRLLAAGDLLVLNDTRVVPARVIARKPTGGRVEILLENLLDDPTLARVRLGTSKRLREGMEFGVGEYSLILASREEDFFLVRLVEPAGASWAQLLHDHGTTPLPPYIRREARPADAERYQTVYATRDGSVAAPTAGLHFDHQLFAELDDRGIQRVAVTLHVGAGTYQPVSAERVEDHRLHSEWIEISAPAAEEIMRTKKQGGRVIAVGTTAARTLESVSGDGAINAFCGQTQLFLHPDNPPRFIDGLVTNFHLPRSSLLMLVAAFAGRKQVLAAYEHAIAARYRFFSYGDAMLVL